MIYFGLYFSIKFWALLYLILNILSNEEKIVELNVENQLVMEKQRFCFALIVVRFLNERICVVLRPIHVEFV